MSGETQVKERETWSNALGFFMASVGSAIGLGNIWLFPWRLSEFGSISFMVPYLVFTFAFVVFGLMIELAFGRVAQCGAVGAFEKAFGTKKKLGTILGSMQVIAQGGITVFYLIVLGWILRYVVLAITGDMEKMDAVLYFKEFTGSANVLPWHLMATLIILGIIMLGVQNGLERLNKWTIPGMFILFIVLIVRSLTLPGGMEGLAKLADPKWDNLMELNTWVMAMGQSFFTVSLGGMLIYGSYLKKDVNIPKTSYLIAITNLFASLLAAVVIIPAVYAFNLNPQAGPALLFNTMPNLFKLMPAGWLFGDLFFIAVFLAGVSSAVNLLETLAEALMHISGWKRAKAALLVTAVVFLVGVPLSIDKALLDQWIDIVTIYIYPLGVVLIFIVALWIFGSDRIMEELRESSSFPIGHKFGFFQKYVLIIVCIIVIVFGIIHGGIG